jgi:hypothetical protein
MDEFWTIWTLESGGYFAEAARFTSRRTAEVAFEKDFKGRPRQLRDPRDVVRHETST